MEHRFYDIDKFNRGLPITTVMKDFGLDVATGRNVSCPSVEHKDNRPSAKIYENNNICYCFSCQKRMNVVDIASETLGVGWKEACDYLIGRYPCEGFYHDFGEKEAGTERFPLNGKDAKLLNLSLSSEGDYSLYDLWKEDRECFNEILSKKLEEKTEDIESAIDTTLKLIEYLESRKNEMLLECEITEEEFPKFEKQNPGRFFSPDSYEYKLLYYSAWLKSERTDLAELRIKFDRCTELLAGIDTQKEHDEPEADR